MHVTRRAEKNQTQPLNIHHRHGPLVRHVHHHLHRDVMVYGVAPGFPNARLPKVRMANASTMTDDPLPQPPGSKTWRAWGEKLLRKAHPAFKMLGSGIVFAASRINFGFGFKVAWLPYIGMGAG